MADVFAVIQKVILATILAWLGLQFTPSDSDKSEKDKKGPSSAIVSVLQ